MKSTWCIQDTTVNMMQTDATDQKFENWLASEYLQEKHHEVKYKEVRAEETESCPQPEKVKLPRTGRDSYCSTVKK